MAGIGLDLEDYEYVRTPGKILSYGTVGAPCTHTYKDTHICVVTNAFDVADVASCVVAYAYAFKCSCQRC